MSSCSRIISRVADGSNLVGSGRRDSVRACRRVCRPLGRIDVAAGLDASSPANTATRELRGVIAVSQATLAQLHSHFGLHPHKGEVIHYGRPVEFFRPRDPQAHERIRRSLGIPPAAVVCLTAARFAEVKGFQDQIEAIRRLRNTKAWQTLVSAGFRSSWATPAAWCQIRQSIPASPSRAWSGDRLLDWLVGRPYRSGRRAAGCHRSSAAEPGHA